MTTALVDGRGLNQPDKVLLDAPRSIRNDFLLLPNMNERNTRDRSFLIKDLDECETEPFFYPLLPFSAAGMDAIVPGDAIDYFVPLCGLFFIFAFLMTGSGFGKCSGLVVALALLVGSPLPVWLFRGFYVESVGAILVCLPILSWLKKQKLSRIAYFSLGLAVSFHPVMLAVSLPVLILFLMTPTEKRKDCFLGLLAYAMGVLPLVLMTIYICAPYGGISFANIVYNFKVSASHRIATMFGVGGMLALLIMVLGKKYWIRFYPHFSREKWPIWIGGLVLSFVPLALSLMVWEEKSKVMGGLRELYCGLQFPFAVVLAFFVIITLTRGSERSRLLLFISFICLPVYAYLKGAETMGLWSQRRLIPFYLILITAILPFVAAFVDRLRSRRVSMVIMALILGAGFSNMVRWPAPYFVRVDRGATNFVERIRDATEDGIVFFDYHTFSNPFSVDGKTKAYGLCQRRKDRVGEVMEWLSEKTFESQVSIVTPYANPGIEDGMVLMFERSERVNLPRVRSKTSLPAEKGEHDLEVFVLKAFPVSEYFSLYNSLPELNKVMDRGPLGLRGSWGTGRIALRDPNGQALPAMWSREGSAFIGPVPPKGGKLTFEIIASACREDGLDEQEVSLHVPWSDKTYGVVVTNGYTVASITIKRGRGKDESEVPFGAGKYYITASDPYDPAQCGIRGFDEDLGVLIHRINMKIEKQ